MTADNPFTRRLAQAAKEGYVTDTRRSSFRTPFNTPNHPANLFATDKQQALIVSLLSERDLTAETRPKFAARLRHFVNDPHGEAALLDRTKASSLIEYLFGLPVAETQPAALDTVPAGHYALIKDGAVVFYRVDRPVEGKWAGKVFVSLLHGPDETRISRVAANTILGRIHEMGPALCSAMYGRHIGRCGVCHRRLTNEESRAAGMGRTCREKFGQ